MIYEHKAVLRKEVLKWLNPKPGDTVIDATLGGAGHGQDILQQIEPNGTYIGIDLDPAAIEHGHETLDSKYTSDIKLVHDNFKHITQIAHDNGCTQVNSILFDLGFSSYHVDQSKRGFAFSKDEPLDMRFNPNSEGALTAEKIINTFPEQEISRIIWEYGEDRFSRKIAAEIVKQRREKKIVTTAELEEVISRVASVKPKQKQTFSSRTGRQPINPATRTFQALRIAVNDELENIRAGVSAAIKLLKPGGRIAVISFHSLEDRIIKNIFRQESRDCICPPELPVCRCEHNAQLEVLTKKIIQASREETYQNRRARSAKMRVAQKI